MQSLNSLIIIYHLQFEKVLSICHSAMMKGSAREAAGFTSYNKCSSMMSLSTFSAMNGERVATQPQIDDSHFDESTSGHQIRVTIRINPSATANPPVTYSSKPFDFANEGKASTLIAPVPFLGMPLRTSQRVRNGMFMSPWSSQPQPFPIIMPTFKKAMKLQMGAQSSEGGSSCSTSPWGHDVLEISNDNAPGVNMGGCSYAKADIHWQQHVKQAQRGGNTPSKGDVRSHCGATGSISSDDLRKLFHLPLVDAAKKLGMGVTVFKALCRRNNISKWPYRSIHSKMKIINDSVKFLAASDYTVPDCLKESHLNKIKDARKKIEEIKENAVHKSTLHDDVETSTSHSGTDDGETSDQDGDSISDIGKISNTSSVNSESSKYYVAEDEGSDENEDPRKRNLAECLKSGTANNDIWLSILNSSEESVVSRKRKRKRSSSDLASTGWIANCTTCGKVGKYRGPSEGRPFQHSYGGGEYCGYFRNNPRRIN